MLMNYLLRTTNMNEEQQIADSSPVETTESVGVKMTGGTRANYTGNSLEGVIEFALQRKGYTEVTKKEFGSARYLNQRIYCKHYF